MTQKSKSPAMIHNHEHNDYSYSSRDSDAGFPANINQIVSPLPTTATKVGKKTAIRIINDTGATIYLALGDDSVAAPTNMTDGVAILDGTDTIINTNENTHVRFSAAGTNTTAQMVVERTHASGEGRIVDPTQ